jgi:hypothetical protein
MANRILKIIEDIGEFGLILTNFLYIFNIY